MPKQMSIGMMPQSTSDGLDAPANVDGMTLVTLAGYCVHSTVVPAIVPKFVFAPSEEIDGKELLFSNGGGCYE